MVETEKQARERLIGERKGIERYEVGWFSYWGRRLLPLILIVVVILGVYFGATNETVRTRMGVVVERSKILERVSVGLRDTTSRVKNFIFGVGEWKAPKGKEERGKRGIEIVSLGPRSDLPFRLGEKPEVVAEVMVYALDDEEIGSSMISFSCEYVDDESKITSSAAFEFDTEEDIKESEVYINAYKQNEIYVDNNENKSLDVKCILPAINEVEGEFVSKKVNFYASYSDFVTTSTMYVSVLGEGEFLSREKEGTLYDFLKDNMRYPNLISRDRKGISKYTKGPAELSLVTDKLPFTEGENRHYGIMMSFTPDWTGEIDVKSLEFSVFPDVFYVTWCDLRTSGIWEDEGVENCNDGCQRKCDFDIVGVDKFQEYEIKARAVYDYTIEETTSVTVRNIA